jgi:hypothetical protein
MGSAHSWVGEPARVQSHLFRSKAEIFQVFQVSGPRLGSERTTHPSNRHVLPRIEESQACFSNCSQTLDTITEMQTDALRGVGVK